MVNSGIVFERAKKTAVHPALGVRFLGFWRFRVGFFVWWGVGGCFGGDF